MTIPFINTLDDNLIPMRKTKESAGYDIYSPIDLKIKHDLWYRMNTGIVIKERAKVMDCNRWFIMIFPRSSYGFKYGLEFKNTVPIIDMDYHKEIELIFRCDRSFDLHKGDRFAQMVIVPFTTFCGELPPSEVRIGGIGSTDNPQGKNEKSYHQEFFM